MEAAVGSSAAAGTGAMLYVGDLAPDVTQEVVLQMFKDIGKGASSVKLTNDKSTGKMGFAIVTMQSEEDAKEALEALNYFPLNGKQVRLSRYERNPARRRQGKGNIYVKNLDASIDSSVLHATFAAFGTILSCKVVTDPKTGQSRRFGFVNFESEEVAERAIREANGKLLGDSTVALRVEHYQPSHLRPKVDPATTFTNLYMKHVRTTATADDIRAEFGKYGQTTSIAVTGKGVAFCAFKTHEEAKAALEAMHDTEPPFVQEGKKLHVERFMSKKERAPLRAARREQARLAWQGKPNYYLKDFGDDVTDEVLREVFVALAGDNVASVRVMREPDGMSKGFGFVSFKAPEGVDEVVDKANGHVFPKLGPKPLYMAQSQTKAERQVMLARKMEAQQPRDPFYAQQMPYGHTPFAMPMYPYGGMAMYGGGMPGGMSAPYGMAHYGGMAPMQQPQRTYHQPHPGPQRPPGGGRGGGRQQQRGMGPSGGGGGGGRRAPAEAQPLTVERLRALSPEDQRTALGEELFPRVRAIVGESKAPKITGMLLDLEASDLLHMLQTPAELEAKIQEAQTVLTSATAPKV